MGRITPRVQHDLCRRSRSRRLAFAATALATTLAASDAEALPAPVETLRPSANVESHVTTETSRVLPKWTPSATLWTGYGQNVSPSSGAHALAVDRRTTTYVGLGLGLFDWTELSLGLPLVVHQQGTALDEGDPVGLQAGAVGDLRIGAKGTILRTPRRGFGLGLSFDVTAPTGNPDALTGTGSPSYAPQVLLEQRMRAGITAALNVGYLVRRDLNVGGQIHGDAFTYRAALRVPLDRRAIVAAVGELDGAIAVVRGARHPVSLRGGFRFALRSGVVLGLYGGGSPVAALGVPEVVGLVGVGWAPPGRMGTERAFEGAPPPTAIELARRQDALMAQRAEVLRRTKRHPDDPDGDGVLAEADRCPNVPEDKDGHLDEDGCPDLDDDGDGLRDDIDLCPRQPEVVNGYADDDGCPDLRDEKGRGVTVARLRPERLLPVLSFEAGDVTLTDEAQAELERFAELVRLNPWLGTVALTVHVHPSDDPAADRALAQAREGVVRSILLQRGVDEERIAVGEARAVPDASPQRVRFAFDRTGAPRRKPATTDRLVEDAKRRAGADNGVAAQGPARDE